MEAERMAAISDHIYPAIEWLKTQPEKKYLIKITNLPRIVTENHI
jgi:hypothetical protein